MKRHISTVFLCIIFLLSVFVPPASNAATPTPTITASLPTNPVKIHNGLINERRDTSQDAQANPIEKVPSGAPTPPPTYTGSVDLISVNPSTKNFNIPKLDEVADWLTRVLPYMWAQDKNLIIPHQDNLYISGQARRCITYDGIKLPDQIGNTYKTELINYLPKLITATGLLSAQTVRNTVAQTDGKYTFEGPSYEVNEAPLCDTEGGIGTPQEPKQITLVQGFKLAAWVKSLAKKFKVNSVYISKQLCPECERIHCLLSGCTNGGTDLAYIGDDKKQTTIKESGGMADAFRTVNMDTTKEESPHGQEQNFTKTNTSYTKQMENSADLIKCSLVPPKQRGNVALANEDCAGFVENLPTTTSCDTELSDLPVSDSSCKLCNLDTLIPSGDSLMDQSLPNGLPQLAVQILEAAGSFYHVPASMLLGVMYNEGAFMHPDVWMWTDETVKEWSCSGNVMPKCEEFAHPQTNAKGPFGFLPSDWGMFSSVVHEFDPNRPLDKLSPCNFFDAAFAAAKEIYQDASHLYADQTRYGMPPDSCNGIGIYKGRDRPTSCSVWTRERAALTEWQYGERTCNRTITSAVNFFNRYRCQ